MASSMHGADARARSLSIAALASMTRAIPSPRIELTSPRRAVPTGSFGRGIACRGVAAGGVGSVMWFTSMKRAEGVSGPYLFHLPVRGEVSGVDRVVRRNRDAGYERCKLRPLTIASDVGVVLLKPAGQLPAVVIPRIAAKAQFGCLVGPLNLS